MSLSGVPLGSFGVLSGVDIVKVGTKLAKVVGILKAIRTHAPSLAGDRELSLALGEISFTDAQKNLKGP